MKNTQTPHYFTLKASAGVLPCEVLEGTSWEGDLHRRGGVMQRRKHPDGLSTNSLSLKVLEALFESGLCPEDLALLAHVSTTPDGVSPATAHRLHCAAGLLAQTHCFDLASSCSSFLSALRLVVPWVKETKKHAVIVGSELKSRHVSPGDPVTSFLFGDGAAGLWLGPDDDPTEFLWLEPLVDTSLVDNIRVVDGKLEMNNGKLMYRRTVSAMVEMIRRAQARAEQLAQETKQEVPLQTVYIHQANANLLQDVQREIGSGVHIPILISDIGNTVSVSMLLHRIRCLLLRRVRETVDSNRIFDRAWVLDRLQRDRSALWKPMTQPGLVFQTHSGSEKVVLVDLAATSPESSWLGRISNGEWARFFEFCPDQPAGAFCDAWIVAGGGFQALGGLHVQNRLRKPI